MFKGDPNQTSHLDKRLSTLMVSWIWAVGFSRILIWAGILYSPQRLSNALTSILRHWYEASNIALIYILVLIPNPEWCRLPVLGTWIYSWGGWQTSADPGNSFAFKMLVQE